MSHNRPIAGLLAAGCLSFAASLGGAPTAHAAQAAGGPIIYPVATYDAPAGGKGGFQNTFVRCRNAMVEPRAVMRVRRVNDDWRRTYRWTGALPGLFFPRVVPGTYKVTTTATCSGVSGTKTEKVTIAEKTAETTISRAEFNAVELGMSRSEVNAMVGFEGRDRFTSGGETSYTYDNMSFWDWSVISFRNDRVVLKLWKVAHD